MCKKYINLSEDKFTLLATCNREKKKKDELVYFHFNCFIEYHEKKTMEKAKNIVNEMQVNTLKVLDNPQIKKVMEKISGTQALIHKVEDFDEED